MDPGRLKFSFSWNRPRLLLLPISTGGKDIVKMQTLNPHDSNPTSGLYQPWDPRHGALPL